MEGQITNSSELLNVINDNSSAPFLNQTIVIATSSNEWKFMVLPYLIIFCVSLSGNSMVIVTLVNKRIMRTVTNIYLLNLAVSDFLLGALCLPFTLIGQIYRRFLFGTTMCKLIPFFQAVSVSVSVWTLVAISLERYHAICHPLKSRTWQTKCHAYRMIATVWIMSFALNSPILVVSTLQPMRGNAFKCRELWQNLFMERAFNLLLDIAMLVVPLFIMVFAYSLIACKLWRGMRHEIQQRTIWQNNSTAAVKNSSAQVSEPEEDALKELEEPENKSDQENAETVSLNDLEPDFRDVVRSTHIDKSIETKRKVIKMLFVIVAEFFVCWTPLHVINTMYLFYPAELYKHIGIKGVMTLQLLAFCSSCCNPVTYCFMNRNFQQAFLELFTNCQFLFCNKKDNVRAKSLTPPPLNSSQEVAACVIRGNPGPSELEGPDAEECV